MRFRFTAPFRTAINVRTDAVLAKVPMTREILAATVADLQGSVGIETNWGEKSGASLRYESLQDDFVPLSAWPLFHVRLDSAEDLQLIAAQVSEAMGGAGPEPVIHSAGLELYDNTIALLVLELSFPDGERQRVLENIDQWSTRFCTAIAGHFQDAVAAKVAESLFRHASKRKARTRNLPELMVTPERFVVFFDIGEMVEGWSAGPETVLWVNRVLFLDRVTNADIPLLGTWTQVPLDADSIGGETGFRSVNAGNSLFIGPVEAAEKQAFQLAMNIAQYFYSLYDLIDENLRTMYPRLAVEQGRRKLDQLHKRISRSLSAIEYTGVSLDDVLRGLQGHSRQWIERIFEAWDFADVRVAVAKKSRMTNSRLEKLIAERDLGYRRWVEGFLALIGAIALIDTAINMLTFSHDEISADPYPGLVDIVRKTPPDALIYFAILLAMIIAFIYWWKTD